MAEIKYTQKDKLICGIIFNLNYPAAHDLALIKLEESFGIIDLHLQTHIKFDFTDYYNKQMGTPLYRCFISFKELVDPSRLAEIKIFTNEIEIKIKKEMFTEKSDATFSPHRIINLDPGLLNPSRLILASTKNYSHRIYLQSGIYAELELLFTKNNVITLPWTYPDYKTPEYQNFFIKARKILLEQLKNK